MLNTASNTASGRRSRGCVLYVAVAFAGSSLLIAVVGILAGVANGAGIVIAGLDVVVATGATVLAAKVSHRRTGAQRRVWALLAAGSGAWALGTAIWMANLATGRSLPTPGPSDVFYLMVPLAWGAAAVLLYGSPGEAARPSSTARTLALLDSLVVAMATLLIVWTGAFSTSGLTLTDRSALLTLVYPIADAVVVAMLWRSVRRTGTDHRAFTLILAGAVWFMLGDVALLATTYLLGVSDPSPTLLDSTWVAGFVLIGGGAWISLGGAERSTPAPDRVGRGTVPLVMGTSAAVIGLIDLTRSDGGTWSIATLVVLMSLLLARQSLTLRENRHLSTELARSVADLEHRAGRDPLTELANREHLEVRLGSLLRTAQVDRCSAVMFIDVDRLKPVNDSLGHRQGDRLLRTVADRLRNRWGDGDVIRIGGDEFVVLVRNLDSTDEVRRQAEALVDDMLEPATCDGVELQPSVSVGVALVDSDATPDELLRRSDLALYHAKQQGRRRSAVFDTSMEPSEQNRLEVATHLRRAVEEDRFELHYQPAVELATGRVLTVEALLRWRHPELGLLTPEQFLPEADALGLMGEIGRRSLFEATRSFARLNAGRTEHRVRVSVNLSAGELGDSTLLNVADALDASGLDPSLLVLEITEDVIVDGSVGRTLSELCNLGVLIAIDDFGTGNSSLRQLGDYPASVLKIDRGFVDGMTGGDARIIVTSILGLAGRLGLTTVAEGVETPEQARLLAELGCDHAQGWLFERAVPFDELVRRWFDRPDAVDRVRRLLDVESAVEDEPVDPQRPQLERRSPPQRRTSATSAPSMIRSSSSATDGSSSITPTT